MIARNGYGSWALKTGRPTKEATPGTRVSLGLKVTPAVKGMLDTAARENGRTQSQEAELRIEQSFARQGERLLTLETLRSPQLTGLISLLFVVMKRAIEEAHLHSTLPEEGGVVRTVDWQAMDWLADPYAFDQMAQAAFAILELFRPNGDVGKFANGASPKGNYLQWLGAALAYSIVRDLLASPGDGHENGLVDALRHDLARHLASVSLPDSPNALIEKLKVRADRIAADASTVRTEQSRTEYRTEADHKLIQNARKRAARKGRGL